jgi:hypothetical protein
VCPRALAATRKHRNGQGRGRGERSTTRRDRDGVARRNAFGMVARPSKVSEISRTGETQPVRSKSGDARRPAWRTGYASVEGRYCVRVAQEVHSRAQGACQRAHNPYPQRGTDGRNTAHLEMKSWHASGAATWSFAARRPATTAPPPAIGCTPWRRSRQLRARCSGCCAVLHSHGLQGWCRHTGRDVIKEA